MAIVSEHLCVLRLNEIKLFVKNNKKCDRMLTKNAWSIARKTIEDYIPPLANEIADKQMVLKYMDTFPDILERENVFAHFTSTAFVFNKERTKTLFVHHNIAQNWSPPGGHNDGDPDFLHVAIKEAKEETGVDVTPITGKILTLDIFPVWGHYRKGQWVSAHQHINIVYAMEADENAPLTVLPDENSDVRWFPVEDVYKVNKYAQLYPIHQKILERVLGKPFPHNV